MKALAFLIWLRDEMHCCPCSNEGKATDKPSNAELRRWLDKNVVLCNAEVLKRDSDVTWPIMQLVFFPTNDKKRCTII